MGNWSSKAVTIPAIEFDGDMVVFQVKRLRVEDMQTLMKFFDAEKQVLKFSDPLEVCVVAQTIVPKYVVGVSGMLDEDGVAVPLEQFVDASKEFYFVPLVAKLFTELISVSSVRAQAKNLPPPSVG